MSFLENLKYRIAVFSIAEKLILFNVVCFFIPKLLNVIFFLFNIPSAAFFNWFQLSSNLGVFVTRPWTLITYSFLHSTFFHLLWNMLLLYYAGRMVLNLFPKTIFINNYFLGVISGGIIFILSYALFPVFSGIYPPMIGASAGVMAVFIFICTYTPDQEIRFLFFNVKLKYLGIAFFLIDVIQIPSGNSGGHLAHIGGAILGFFYARQLASGRDIGKGFQALWQSLVGRKKMKTVHRASKAQKSQPKKTTAPDHQKKIDAILDKISKSGYDSLTKEEKDYLFRAGKE